MPQTLSFTASIADADSSAIEIAFSGLGPAFRKNSWLLDSNQYKTKPNSLLATIFEPPYDAALNGPDLVDYIAASVPGHCLDAWGYLSRALNAYLLAQPHIARHLAYYAELRAVLAILAAQGIAIFDKHHIVVTSRSKCAALRQSRAESRTHQVIWQQLKAWSELPVALSAFDSSIRVDGIGLAQWLSSGNTGSTASKLVAEWLDNWGMDLVQMRSDRTTRNDASYAPSSSQPPRHTTVQTAYQFALDCWDALSPDGDTRFGRIDRHLLRRGVERVYLGSQTLPTMNTRQLVGREQRIQGILTQLNPQAAFSSRWKDFLLRSDEPDDLGVIARAVVPTGGSEIDTDLGILARALLLSRIATGFTRRLFQVSGLTPRTLYFWRKRDGVDLGFWKRGCQPADYSDLWLDTIVEIGDAKFSPQTSSRKRSLEEWRRNSPRFIDLATQLERVPIWALS